MRRLTVPEGGLLFEYLCGALGVKRKAVKALLKFGAVSLNGRTIRQFDHPLAAGDEVAVSDVQSAVAVNRLQYAQIQLVYEDAALLVLDKPSGLLTIATDRDRTDTLFYRLNEFLHGRDTSKRQRAWVVHRLDQDTSGLVLFAKTEPIKLALQAAWPDVTKVYWAIVEGRPPQDEGTIKSYLTETKALQVYSNGLPSPGGRLATTHYRVLQTREDLSLLEVRLETGRKHQIRVHLQELGCPVAGDKRYGATSDPCHRLALHAASLSLVHPLAGEPLNFRSPFPGALKRLFPHPERLAKTESPDGA